MTRIVLPYCKVLVQTPQARSTLISHGNEVTDNLADPAGRTAHVLANARFWPQSTLNAYTPNYFFKAYNSVITGGNEAVRGLDIVTAVGFPAPPEPDLSNSPYGTVKWKRTSGLNLARSLVPDGDPKVSEIKIMPGTAPAGTFWGFQTDNLGTHGWDLGYKATKSGYLPQNGGVTITVRRGKNETPPDSALAPPSTEGYSLNANPLALVTTRDNYLSNVLQLTSPIVTNEQTDIDVRVAYGGYFSVKIPGDGSAPSLEQKSGVSTNGGSLWSRIHTFTGYSHVADGDGNENYFVTFAPIAGRLAVCVNSHELPANAYVYVKYNKKKHQSPITVRSNPVTVTGVVGGAPVWIGIRHFAWHTFGVVQSSYQVTDAVTGIPSTYVGPNAPFGVTAPPFITGWFYRPDNSYGLLTAARQPSPTVVEYQATLCSSTDNREPTVLKWTHLSTPRVSTPGTSAFIDYGPAVTRYVEHQPEPDFSGTGNRGSDSYVDLTFDIYALDQIDKKGGGVSNWRTTLVKFSPVAFVMGNVINDETAAAGTPPTTEEFTRIKGYLVNPKVVTNGFQDSLFTCTVRDGYLRLKRPAGFIDKKFKYLVSLTPRDGVNLYGWECVQYILQTVFDTTVDAHSNTGMRVYMPPDWPAFANKADLLQVTGQLPTDDKVTGRPPYYQDAASWIKEIATSDNAAAYFAGDVFVYGQYDRIIAALPTIQMYDGTDTTTGLPTLGSMDDTKLRYSISKVENATNTNHDYNSVFVPGRLPNGDLVTGPITGQGILGSTWKNYADVNATWERTLFVDGAIAELSQDLNDIMATSYGRLTCKTPFRYKVDLNFAIPSLFFGYKAQLNGAKDAGMNGKVLRVVDVTTEGDMIKKKAKMSFTAVDPI